MRYGCFGWVFVEFFVCVAGLLLALQTLAQDQVDLLKLQDVCMIEEIFGIIFGSECDHVLHNSSSTNSFIIIIIINTFLNRVTP